MSKRVTATTLAAIMAVSTAMTGSLTAQAAETYTYDAPTSPMTVDSNIITASAHRAASPILGILGCNATSGFGMINGSAPSTLAEAQTKPALAIWGSSLNDNPDPYYWNYFYNFYASENNLATASDALINSAAAASPAMADGTLVAEYGNVSASLYTRPQILVGCASTGAGQDTNGYASQLATINSFTSDSEYYQEGDETYNPVLVGYQMTRLTNMIDTMYTLADAMDTVTQQTGSVGRYGDPQVIASDYEKYVYGTSAYVLSEIAKGNATKKTVAIVSAINDDGTFTLANAESMAATSNVRYVEYTALVSDNLANKLGKTTVTAEELMQADAVITTNTQDGAITSDGINYNGASDYLSAMAEKYNVDPMIITTSPNALYGITMNSVENAMGLGYLVGYLYSDELAISPVDMCAYFYEHFYHISDRSSLAKVVQTNFGSVILPEGISGTLSSDYSAEDVESLLAEGMLYYQENSAAFEGTYIAEAGWEVDWTQGIGSTSITGESKFDVKVGESVALAQESSVGASLTYKSDDESVATVDNNGNVKALKAGTVTITVTAAKTETSPEVTKKITVTVTKKSQSISVKTPATKTYGDKAFSLNASAKTALTYKSSNEKVATVDKTGKVTIVGAGTATIAITAAEDATYSKATKDVKVTVNKASQSISVSKTSYSKTYGDKAFSLGAKAQGTLSYDSSNKKVATVDKNGKVTIKGAGTATITIKAAATTNYKAATNKTVKVTVKAASQSITVKKASASYKKADVAKKAQTFSIGASAKTKVSYKVTKGTSKNITVNSKGVVTVKKGAAKGTYKITVTAKATTNYKVATKTVTVTVK
jgi:hypothetical protein